VRTDRRTDRRRQKHDLLAAGAQVKKLILLNMHLPDRNIHTRWPNDRRYHDSIGRTVTAVRLLTTALSCSDCEPAAYNPLAQ